MNLLHPADCRAIEACLRLHLTSAAIKDVPGLRSAFTENAVFVGTDDSEIWSIDRLAEALEHSRVGWNMSDCMQREIYAVGRGSAAFCEFIIHEKLGPMRGSGVIVKTGESWRIAHYVLSFSVPNHVVDETNLLDLLATKKL